MKNGIFIGLALIAAALFGLSGAPISAAAEGADLGNAGCLQCHESAQKKIEVPGKKGENRALAHVDAGKFGRAVHGEMQCVACHTNIVDSQANHVKAKDVAPPNCVSCHQALWEKVKNEKLADRSKRLGDVVANAEAYRGSYHTRPDREDPTRPMATCEDCHSSHEFAVPPQGTARRIQWHKNLPETCAAKCHSDALDDYVISAHGTAHKDKGDLKAPVCTDCHPPHAVKPIRSDSFKLDNVETCGNCHEDRLKTFADSYHGQVNRLGFSYAAKCADCHENHRILPVSHPKSSVHPKNRLATCQKCHNEKKTGRPDATEGFITFGPHANTHDFAKYPEVYIAAKFMTALLLFVFAFFWSHSGLWYLREWKDRKSGVPHARIDTKGLDLDEEDYYVERFSPGWRLAHLVFAIVTMTLVLTGTTALYADSAWAPAVAKAVGGPKILGLIHRACAIVFVGIFVIHFVYVMLKLLRDRKFRWFGPDSLIPNWKDLADCIGMFKWFLGLGPKPMFDRWAYYEKFDYWAVFWGVNVIGWSGLMLAFPHVTAKYLPGWVLNVATLVHGEEAFLAAVFLFTVHFFNNHFRPDKLPPPDIVMFTGTQTLREFRHDHPAQYQRLVDSGELEKRLVSAPTCKMRIGSILLGLLLIGIGFILLALVGIGFFTKL